MSRFDEFAKLLAEDAVTRRDSLRKLGSGLAVSALAMVGIGCDTSPTSPNQGGVARVGVTPASDQEGGDDGKKCKADNKECKKHADCCNGYCDATGTCGCKSGTTNCSGTCTYTSMDAANCGACGNKCPSGKACLNGVCVGGSSVCAFAA